MGSGKLLLADLRFEVVKAGLMAVVPDPYWCDKLNDGRGKRIVWCLDVEASSIEVDGEAWQPSAEWGALHLPVRRWVDIEGTRISWDQPFDPETGADNGSLYVFEHGDMPEGTIASVGRTGNILRMQCFGRCDVHYDDRYGENVPFEIEADVLFEGVRVDGSVLDQEDDFRRRLEGQLSSHGLRAGDFEDGPGRYEGGVKMRSRTFTALDDA